MANRRFLSTCFLANPISFLTLPFTLPPLAASPGTGNGSGTGSAPVKLPTGKALTVDSGSSERTSAGLMAVAPVAGETAEVPNELAMVMAGVLGLWILITGIRSKISPNTLGVGWLSDSRSPSGGEGSSLGVF